MDMNKITQEAFQDELEKIALKINPLKSTTSIGKAFEGMGRSERSYSALSVSEKELSKLNNQSILQKLLSSGRRKDLGNRVNKMKEYSKTVDNMTPSSLDMANPLYAYPTSIREGLHNSRIFGK